jgi:RNA polymerase sigma factor (sigma-70 family)
MSELTETMPVMVCLTPLVNRLKSQEPDAWEDVLALHAPNLRRTISASLRRRGLPLDYADDIEQETWLTAVKRIKEFRAESDDMLLHWVRAIALNHVRNLQRKERQTISFDEVDDSENCVNLDELLFTYGLSHNTLESEVILRERISTVDKALRALKPQDRELLIKRLMWEQKPEELARDYPDLKPRSISQSLVRAKVIIRSRCDGF